MLGENLLFLEVKKDHLVLAVADMLNGSKRQGGMQGNSNGEIRGEADLLAFGLEAPAVGQENLTVSFWAGDLCPKGCTPKEDRKKGKKSRLPSTHFSYSKER